MVYLMQSYMIQEGKSEEAWASAAKIAAYAHEHYSEHISVEVLRNINGPAFQVHFLIRFESLAAFDEISTRWFGDPKVKELNAKSSQFWVDSSFVNNFFATVP